MIGNDQLNDLKSINKVNVDDRKSRNQTKKKRKQSKKKKNLPVVALDQSSQPSSNVMNGAIFR